MNKEHSMSKKATGNKMVLNAEMVLDTEKTYWNRKELEVG